MRTFTRIFLTLLFNLSLESLFVFDLLNFHEMFLPYGFHLWTVKTFDPLNSKSPSMSNPHMHMVSTY